MTPEPIAVACACEPDISEPSPLCPVHGIEGWRDEPTAATASPRCDTATALARRSAKEVMHVTHEVEAFDEQQVLAVLRERGKPMAWSRIVMAIRGVPYEHVRIAQVRGVRDACRSLQAKGLVSEQRPLMFKAAS